MPGLPVDVPSLHGGVSPCLQMVPLGERHPHDPVGAHPQQLLLLLPVEPHHEQTDAVLGQGLPRADEVHF